MPAIWDQQYPLANKGYARHEFFFFWNEKGILSSENPQKKAVSNTHPAGDVLWVFVEPGNVVP